MAERNPFYFDVKKEDGENPMKNKLIAIILFLLIMSTAAVHAAEGANQPNLFLLPEQRETEIGQDVRFTVVGEGLEDLYGYEIRLAYDSERLRFKEAIPAWNGFQVPPIVKDGTITVAHTKVGRVGGENGDTEIVTLVFEVIGAGEAQIRLENAKLVNSRIEPVTIKPGETATLSVTAPVSDNFVDIAGHWAKDSILRAARLGLVNGYPDGTFRPNRHVTRGEFAALLARALKPETAGVPEPALADWKDVPEWAKPYVAAVYSAGWMKGYPDGTIRVQEKITRAEMAVMTVRAAGIQTGQEQLEAAMFADYLQIPAWAASEAAAAHKAGLVTGKPGSRFDPFAYTTRAEAVTVILRLLDMLEARNF